MKSLNTLGKLNDEIRVVGASGTGGKVTLTNEAMDALGKIGDEIRIGQEKAFSMRSVNSESQGLWYGDDLTPEQIYKRDNNLTHGKGKRKKRVKKNAGKKKGR